MNEIHLPIALRAYAEPIDMEALMAARQGGAPLSAAKAKRRLKKAGASKWTLVFDTETTTGAAQRFKVGSYRLYEGDRLDEERLFVDADALSAAELAVVEGYAEARRLGPIMTLTAFREEVLLARGYGLGATIVTFNGPFDFSRVALRWSPSRASKWRTKMQGGFTFVLSEDPAQPRIQIKNLNSRASFVEWTAPRKQQTSRLRRKRGERTPTYRGHFVDVKTLAAALTARSHSLASLTETLKTPTQKVRSEEHGKPVSEEYLDYARADVAATWECFTALREKYLSYGLATPIHEVTSEASIGKAALATMGIKPWREVQPGGLDPALTSLILSTYFGGRTEVRIRRQLVSVRHTDFTSMYPTVCTLQGLWAFVISEGFSCEVATERVRAFVESATPALFQKPASWRELTTLVRIRPDRDLLPVRADYAGGENREGKSTGGTIGLNQLSSEGSLWITLADCLNAKFLSGRAPVVEEALAFSPGAPQQGLKSITLLGRHVIDPYKQDFYRELIRARQQEEVSKDGKKEEEEASIEAIREALKITANATSYGIFVQVNVSTSTRGQLVRVYRPLGGSFVKKMNKTELPGPWFNPLIATLITGAARLMLGLAELQVLNEGLNWAFCDTDSLAIAQTIGEADDDFEARVDRVVNWFRPLNPYGFDESILKLEKVNLSPTGGKARAKLYCWAISSKRYALFNIDSSGRPIIRKASAHGLGHLLSPYDPDDAPTCFPKPLEAVLSGKEKLQRWHYDAWCAILEAELAGDGRSVRWDYHPALKRPTASRYAATSPDLLDWFTGWNEGRPYEDTVKPFGFMHALHSSRRSRHPDEMEDPFAGSPRREALYPVAPYDRDRSRALASAFDRVTSEPVAIADLETYKEALAGYPFSEEAKFLNAKPFDRGVTERRHVRAVGTDFIGKEADRWEEEYFLGLRGSRMLVDYGGDAAQAARASAALRGAVGKHGALAVSKATGVSRATLAKLKRGERASTTVQYALIHRGLTSLEQAREHRRSDYDRSLEQLREAVARAGSIRKAAAKLSVDASNLSKKLRAECNAPKDRT